MRALSLGRDLAVGQSLEREPGLAVCAAVSSTEGILRIPHPGAC